MRRNFFFKVCKYLPFATKDNRQKKILNFKKIRFFYCTVGPQNWSKKKHYFFCLHCLQNQRRLFLLAQASKTSFLCAHFIVTVNIFCGHTPSLKATCLNESFKLWSYNSLEGQVFSPKPLLPNGELQYFKFILQNFVCSTNYLPLCPTFYKAMDTENAGLTQPYFYGFFERLY